MNTLKIDFENERALKHFAVWMTEEGEQTYWEWMKVQEEKEEGPITVNFHYHGPNNKGSFLEDNIIRTTCERMDSDD